MSNTITIESTTDYSKFQFMGGNRKVQLNHVAKIEKEMQYDPEMFQSQPIVVNENFFIVDGQHRFSAARNLNVPIYYIIKPGATVEVARHLNTTQKRWTLMDFAESHAAGGKKDYIEFVRLARKYPSLTMGTLIMYLQNSNNHGMEANFRGGNFVIHDQEEAEERLNMLIQVQEVSGQKLNMPMARSFMKLWNDDNEFDFDVFIKKLGRDTAKDEFVIHGIIRNCLRSIEDVYNFQSKVRTRLY